MIEKFKFKITETNRSAINNYLSYYANNLSTFSELINLCEQVFHIGFSFYIANKLGCSYEQIECISEYKFEPSKSFQNKTIGIIKDMLSNDSIEVDFYVKDSHKNYQYYLAKDSNLSLNSFQNITFYPQYTITNY